MPAIPPLLPVFNALPGACLLLAPNLQIVAASDAYLAATLTRRDQLLGSYLFDAFPDNPQAPEADGVRNLRASLAQVLATGQPHTMARQHYDVPDPTAPGQFVERYWQPHNSPVLDEQGQVSYLIHTVVNVTEEVRAEVELRASQARERCGHLELEAQRQQLADLLYQAPACIASLRGPEHTFVLANPRYLQLFGGRELVGKPVRKALPELEGQSFFRLMDEVYRTGQTYYGNEELAYLDQTNSGRLDEVYFNFIYQAVHASTGEVTGVLIFAYDVTAQVLARRQVQDLNEELAATNEELHASNEEFLQTNTELMRVQHQVQQLNHNLEARVRARTQEAQAARAMAEDQRDRIERLFMQAPAAICILSGPALVYELVNPAYQALFPERELLGHPIAQALPEIVTHEVLTTFHRVFETGVSHEERSMLIPIVRPEDGVREERYFNYIQQARYDEYGRVDGVLVFAFEVTDQVLANQQVELAREQVQLLNEELAVTNEELQATNEELGDSNYQLTRTNADLDNFIYTASHDLRAPITNIEGLVLALQHELPTARPDSQIPYLLVLMQESVDRFKRTISHLTDISSLQKEHGRATTQVRLAEVVENVRLDMLPQLEASQAQLTIEVPSYATLTFSEKNLRSVVYNLLSNALKYCHPDRAPEVLLSYRTEVDYQVLAVQDNGLGLDMTRSQRLFGMFQRLHDHVEGTGIGLYMVKKMVENAGGRIEVASELGVGSTFSVFFPR